MARTVTDIDVLLGKDELELTLCGRKYVVRDVPLRVFLETSQTNMEDPQAAHKQLAIMFGVNVEDLSDVGFRAAMLALGEIRKWMFVSAGISEEEAMKEAGSEEAVNP